MKKALLIAVAVMFMASFVSATDLPVGYMGVYGDEAHSLNNICPPLAGGWPPVNTFSAYVFCLPSANGLMAAEYAVSVPAALMCMSVANNPLIGTALGDITAGISVAFMDCQVDWVWTNKLTLAWFAAVPAKIEIVANPAVGVYQFAGCGVGYPIEPCIFLTPLYLCTVPEGPLGVQEKNWGAIKSMFE